MVGVGEHDLALFLTTSPILVFFLKLIKMALGHDAVAVRQSAFELIFESIRKGETPTAMELELVEEYLPFVMYSESSRTPPLSRSSL